MALLYPPSTNGLQKTLGAQLDQGVTASLTLNNTTNIQNKPGVCVIDRIDTDGNLKNVSVREFVKYTGTSGSTLTGLTRNVDNSSSDQDHAVGAVVEFIPDVTWAKSVMDTLDGTSTDAVLNTPAITTPKITTSINDSNGNEIIKTPATASAVNEVTVTNAATGNAPSLAATGGDTNIDLNLITKGSGTLKVNGSALAVTQVNDSNGNAVIKTTPATTPVNELTGKNAATGATPELAATGTDTNIHMSLKGKGNGLVKIAVLRQKITTNTYENNSVILTGWGHIPVAGGASTGSTTVTMGITFSAYPIVVPQIWGFKTTSAPTELSDLTTSISAVGLSQGFGGDTITTSSFKVSLKTSANAGGDAWYGFTWIAIGVLN